MLLLIMMLLMGLAAGACGFMACFLPARWYRLTELISFADRWTERSPKRLHPVVSFLNRASGLAIFAVGCWFVYMAATEIWLVQRRTSDKPSGASGQRGASQHSSTGDHCAFDFRGRRGNPYGRFPGKGAGGL